MKGGKATRVRMIDVSEFFEKCLKLVDEVARSGSEIVITKNDRPISRLVPFREKPKSLLNDRSALESVSCL